MFEASKLSDLNYLVWKDIYNVDKFSMGNAELDLLVDIEHKKIFERTIYDDGFIKLKVNEQLRIEGIEHYIKYSDGKYYHLHVYYELITGNHYVKEFKLNFDKSLFNNFYKIQGIKVANESLESTLILIRFVLKKISPFKIIKIGELERLRFLSKKIKADNVEKYFNLIIPELELTFERLMDLATSKKIDFNQKLIRQKLNSYKTIDYQKYIFVYLKIRFVLFYLRLSKSSNKTIQTTGLSLAIIGSDGSGKTTIAEKLFRLYRSKSSCKKIYLGGSFKTYSLFSWLAYFIYYFTRIFSPFKQKYYLAWLFYYNSIMLLELFKFLDRKNKIIKADKLKLEGWIIIYERYPIKDLFDYPNIISDLKSNKWYFKKPSSFIKFICEKIQKDLSKINKPDLSFLIKTDLIKMKARRSLAINEIIDIERKINIQNKYLNSDYNNLIVVENNNELDTTIRFINDQVNNKLCKLNL